MLLNNNDYLCDFYMYLKDEKHSSENTCRAYLRDLRLFSEFTGEDLLLARENHINDYVMYLRGENRSPATVARNIASLKAFYVFCCLKSYLSENPTENITVQRITQKAPEILDRREVELLLEQPQCTDLKGYRDKAILELLYATGIRVGELIALEISDIDFQRETIQCKGAKNRTIPLTVRAYKALSEYVTFIRKQMIRDLHEQILFVNVNGTALTRQGVWKILKEYAKIAGIEKNITPHTLRHSFAAHCLEGGTDINAVLKMMGNSNTASKGLYSDFMKRTR